MLHTNQLKQGNMYLLSIEAEQEIFLSIVIWMITKM